MKFAGTAWPEEMAWSKISFLLKINLNGISGLSEIKIFFSNPTLKVTLYVCHTKTVVGVVGVIGVALVILVLGWLTWLGWIGELGVDGLVEVVRVDGVVSRGRQIF